MTDLPTACRRRVERFVAPSLSTTERAAIVDHAKHCRACADRIAAFERIRGALGAHHAGLEPDAAFRARVLARVADEPAPSALGWAARRLLPLAAALALVLSGWGLALERPSGPAALVFGSLDDDVVAALVVSPPSMPHAERVEGDSRTGSEP